MNTKTYEPKNCVKGIKVTARFKAIFLKEVWRKLNLTDRNFMSGLKNYYDVNGFLTINQYNYLKQKYDLHIDKFTEFQTVIEED